MVIFKTQTSYMKRIVFLLILAISVIVSSCNFMGYHRIHGNGHVITEERALARVEKIKLSGVLDMELSPAPATSVKIEADENVLPYVITRMEDGFLVVRMRDHILLSDAHPIKVYVTTPRLEEVHLSGSGNITGKGRFTGADRLKAKVSGIGNIVMEVNTPEVDATINGSGSITLSGETRNEEIQISGIGDFHGDGLKAETAKVKISGSGNARLYADKSLDARIAGIGSVYYKGNPAISQKISGSGSIQKQE